MLDLFEHAGRFVAALASERGVEETASRDRAAFLTLPWRSILSVEGGDAVSFLHAMLTQDVESMEVGEVRSACQVDRKGRMIADLWLRRETGGVQVDLQSDLLDVVRENLERYLISEDVRLEVPEEMAVILLLGPEAPEIVQREGLSAWPVRETRGPDFHLLSDQPDLLKRRLRGAGAQEIGGETLNRLRIEAGRPWFGKEIDGNSFPMEIGLEEAISYSKGCYIGQETIARVRYRGQLKKGLYGVRIPGGPPAEGSPVADSGKTLASLLSVAGPAGAGDSLGLLLLRREDQTPGRPVQVAGRAATLEPLPFSEVTHG